jgi:acetate---CoA ligase (ADP-forming) subunit beta
MLKADILDIIEGAKGIGWVLEPEAKKLLSLQGLPVPRFLWAKTREEAMNAAGNVGGYPVVAKVVSPKVIHKSDVGGVVVNIADDEELNQAFSRLSGLEEFQGVIVEEMLPRGIELIVGASQDFQFGPIILLGLGGTSVEIYKDTAMRLAPLGEKDVQSMVRQLTAHPLLEGYRGADPIDMAELTRVLMNFSELIMEMEGLFESADLNPVICNKDRCVIADARIILTKP